MELISATYQWMCKKKGQKYQPSSDSSLSLQCEGDVREIATCWNFLYNDSLCVCLLEQSHVIARLGKVGLICFVLPWPVSNDRSLPVDRDPSWLWHGVASAPLWNCKYAPLSGHKSTCNIGLDVHRATKVEITTRESYCLHLLHAHYHVMSLLFATGTVSELSDCTSYV